MRTRSLLVALLLVAPETAWAQLDPAVKVGASVRAQRGNAHIAGRVIEMRGDTIVVRRAPTDTSIAFSVRDATSLEVHGRSRREEVFANFLGVLTASAGAAIFINWCLRDPDECRSLEEDEDPYDDEDPFPVFGTLTIGFGALGLLIGHALTPPGWRNVPLPFRVGLTPSPGGLTLFVSLPVP